MLDAKNELGSDQVVILCPDIDVKSINAVLKLSITGLVNFEDGLNEAREIQEMLACLGATDADISSDKFCVVNAQDNQEREETSIHGAENAAPPDKALVQHKHLTHGDDSDCDMKSDIEEMEVMSACNDDDYIEQLSEEEEEDEYENEGEIKEEEPESTLDPVTGALLVKDLKCPMCSRAFRFIDRLKSHMANCHWKDDIMNLAGTNANDIGTICHLCGKTWAPIKKLSKNKARFFTHIAFGHRYLDEAIPNAMKTKLNEDILKARPKMCKRALFISGSPDESDSPSCPLCNCRFTTLLGLKFHLIQSHLKSEILQTSGVTDCKRCRFCLKVLGNEKTENERRSAMAFHVATIHGYLEKVMDQDLKQKFDELKKMPFKVRIDQRNRKTKPKQDEVSRKGKEYNISLKCPLCSRVFQSYKNLTEHFCRVHYRKDVLRYAKTSDKAIDEAQCNICGKQLKKDVKKRNIKAVNLSNHLALHHKLIDKVVPEEVKKQFNRTLLQAIPNIKKTWLFVTNDTVISGQQCLLCDKRFECKKKFKHHMIGVHFLSSIIDVSLITDLSICNLCDKPGLKVESESNRRSNMARHLAVKHNFLTKVLEKEGLTDRYVEVMDNFKMLKAQKKASN